MLQKVLQELKLPGGEGYYFSSSGNGGSAKIYLYAVELLYLWDDLRWRRVATEMSFDSCHDFEHFEGLRHVVIGADLQPLDLVYRLAAGGQNDDGYNQASLPDVPANVKSPLAGQHDIQKNQIEFTIHRFAETLFAVARRFDNIPGSLKTIGECHPQSFFIFNYHNSFIHLNQP